MSGHGYRKTGLMSRNSVTKPGGDQAKRGRKKKRKSRDVLGVWQPARRKSSCERMKGEGERGHWIAERKHGVQESTSSPHPKVRLMLHSAPSKVSSVLPSERGKTQIKKTRDNGRKTEEREPWLRNKCGEQKKRRKKSGDEISLNARKARSDGHSVGEICAWETSGIKGRRSGQGKVQIGVNEPLMNVGRKTGKRPQTTREPYRRERRTALKKSSGEELARFVDSAVGHKSRKICVCGVRDKERRKREEGGGV